MLPGHIDFSEYDATYSIAENLTGSLVMLKNVPGALRNLLQMTSEKYQFEYILIDMSPNISATNANILMESDVFMSADYKMSNSKPQFIGTIQQRYRPCNGSPSKAFSEWVDDINLLVKNKLVPVLKKCNMIVPYISGYYEEEYNLINIADFNSLIAQSQAKNTPVFMLTKEQVQKDGNVWFNMKKNIDDFNETFNCLADRIVDATKQL